MIADVDGPGPDQTVEQLSRLISPIRVSSTALSTRSSARFTTPRGHSAEDAPRSLAGPQTVQETGLRADFAAASSPPTAA